MSAVCARRAASPPTPRTEHQLFDFDDLEVEVAGGDPASGGSSSSSGAVPPASAGYAGLAAARPGLREALPGLPAYRGLEGGFQKFAARMAATERLHSDPSGKLEDEADRTPPTSLADCVSELERRMEAQQEMSDSFSSHSGSCGGEEEEQQELQVDVIAGLSGSLACTISGIDDSWRVRDLKARIEHSEGIQAKLQRLLVGSRLLQDAEFVEKLFPPSSTTVEVYLVRVDERRAQLLERIAGGSISLADLDDEQKSDRELVLLAVQASQGRALQHAGPWRSDREVVLAAVRRNGLALRHADVRLREDHEVVMEAVKEYGPALEHARGAPLRSQKVVLSAIRQSGLSARFAADALRLDRLLALAAVKVNGDALPHMPEGLLQDRQFLLAALAANGQALQHMGHELRADVEVVLTAVRACGPAVRYAAEELLSSASFALQAVDANPFALEHLPEAMQAHR